VSEARAAGGRCRRAGRQNAGRRARRSSARRGLSGRRGHRPDVGPRTDTAGILPVELTMEDGRPRARGRSPTVRRQSADEGGTRRGLLAFWTRRRRCSPTATNLRRGRWRAAASVLRVKPASCPRSYGAKFARARPGSAGWRCRRPADIAARRTTPVNGQCSPDDEQAAPLAREGRGAVAFPGTAGADSAGWGTAAGAWGRALSSTAWSPGGGRVARIVIGRDQWDAAAWSAPPQRRRAWRRLRASRMGRC